MSTTRPLDQHVLDQVVARPPRRPARGPRRPRRTTAPSRCGCFRPLAESVAVVHGGTRVAARATSTRASGPASSTSPDVPDYRLEVTYAGGEPQLSDDAYRYLPTLGEMDLHLINEGRHEQLWEVLGAHVRRYEASTGDVTGTSFAVWAPNAQGVRVTGDFNCWDGRAHPMRPLGVSGVWELFVPDVGGRHPLQVSSSSAPTTSGARRPTRWPSPPRSRRRPPRWSPSRPTTWGDDDWMTERAQRRRARAADDGLRGAPRLVAPAPRRRPLHLRRARRRAGRLRHRPRLHPRRVPAGDGAPLRRLVGLPGHVVLRPDRALRRPRRVPLPGRPAAPGRHRRDRRLGARRTSPRTSGRWPASTAPRSTSTPTPRAASTPTGAPTSSTSAARRCATSWSPTRCTGSRSSTSTACASTRSPRCSTSTTPARTASGRPTSTAAGRTSRRSRSSRR